MTPLVSIIVPNFNHAEYLSERLGSIFQQTYTNFEVIILDDHSTDYSLEIIDSFRADSRLVGIVVNEINVGSPFMQWKKGLELAKGKIGWIAESDDVSDSTFLQKMVDFYMENHLVMCYSLSKKIDSKGRDCGLVQKSLSQNLILSGGGGSWCLLMEQ